MRVYFKYWIKETENSNKSDNSTFEDAQLFGLTAGIKRIPKPKR